MQAEEFNPNAAPRKVTKGLTVGVYKDKDCDTPLGDEAISTDTTLYGKVNIDFASGEAPTLASPNICYEFPKDQIDVPDQAEATLYDGTGAIAGTWYIKDGVAYLKYSESWLNSHQSGITAHFNFEFMLGAKDQGDDKSETVTFPGASTSTTINTKDGNVSGGKFGKNTNQWAPSFDAEDNSYTWTVKVSPASFATNLVITDKIGSNLDFVEGSFSLVDAGGNPVSGKCDAAINGKTASISLGNLPKGDYYVQYKTVVSSDALKALKDGQSLDGIDNTASWAWGSQGQNKSNEVSKNASSVNYKMVSKSASGNADDITWTVKLNTGNLKADMSNYKFEDTLGEGHSFKEGIQYEVKDASGNVVASGNVDPSSKSLSLNLPANAGKQEFIVTYHTAMDDASSKATNEAKVTPPADSVYPEGSGKAEFRPTDDKTYITKKLVDASKADSDGYATWSSTIFFTNLAENTDPTKIVFHDEFKKQAWTQHMTFDQISVSIVGSDEKLIEGKDYVLSQSGQYSVLEIAFKDTDLVKNLLGSKGHDVVVSYRTHSDVVNDVYTNTSTLKVDNVDKGKASDSYTVRKNETPQVSKKSNSIWWDANYDWEDSSAKGAWIANWSISVNKTIVSGQSAAALDLKGEPIVVTDAMDEGMAYVDGSAQYNLISSDSGNLSKWQQKPEVKTVDGKTVFTIPTDQSKTETGATNVYAELSYNTAIKPSLIEAGANKDFSNKAEAKSGETAFPEGDASASVTNKVLDKTSKRASDDSHVTYTIKVNEHTQDLIADSDTLTLVDEMSSTCSFTNGSLRVMSGSEDITKSISYSLENAINKDGLPITRLTLTVPDSVALTITYDVSPLGAIGDTVSIDNTVSMEGFANAAAPTSGQWQVQKSNAGTEAQGFGFSVKKTDDAGVMPLKGAKFALSKVDLANSTKDSIKTIPVTNWEGEVESDDYGNISFGSKDHPLNSNTVYYFVETQAPDGYECDSTPHYVVLTSNSGDDEYKKTLKNAEQLGLQVDSAAFGFTFNAYNKKNDAPAPTGSATLSLKKTVNGGEPVNGQDFKFMLSAVTDDAPIPNANASVVETKGADASKSFGEITFDTPGTYKYKIEETPEAPNDGNVWTMADPVYAQVTVGDAVDGKLPTSVKYYSDEGCAQELSDDVALFNNTYTAPTPAKATVKVHKTVEAAEGANVNADEQFEFGLYKADEQGAKIDEKVGDSVKVKKDGDGSFGEISFDAEGTYNYVISEIGHNDKGWTAPADVKVQVVVKRSDDGQSFQVESITYDGEKAECASFVDVYAASSVEASLSAKKAFEGGSLADGQFSFKLKQTSAPEGVSFDERTASNDASGDVSFGPIKYDKAGTYEYEISEAIPADAVNGAKDGIAYDLTAHKAKVIVSDNGKGQLVASVTYDGDKSDIPTFTNKKQTPAECSASINITKTINGSTEVKADEDFSFQLFGADAQGEVTGGQVGKTVTVKPGQKASFEAITFDKEGTYNYVIHEEGHCDKGWTAHADVPVSITVTKNATENKLNAVVNYGDGKDTVVFDNTYQATGSATLQVKKLVNGAEPAADQSFSFKVSCDANDPASADAPLPEKTETSTVGSATASFGEIQYTLADAGKTYRYTISETTPATVGWTMASPVTATVTVGKDNGDGTLKPSTVVYSVADTGKAAALFDNKYEQASGEFQLGLVKTVNGNAPAEDQSFEFSAAPTDKSDQGAPTFENVTTDAKGSASFAVAKLSDKDSGKTYVYRIHEVTELQSDSGVWKKAADVIATVKVGARGKENNLPVTVAYQQDGSDAAYGNAAQFNNTYREVGGSFQLALVKSVEGKALDRPFDFKAEAVGENADGAPKLESDTASSSATTGEASFAVAKLTAANKGKTYTYKISETSKLDAAWAKAADVYAHVAVSNELNDDGDLTATVTYSADEQGTDPYMGAAKFTNKYTQASGGFQLGLVKTVNGSVPAEGQSFKFKAASTDEGAPELGEIETDKEGRAAFSFDRLDDSFEGKEFAYTISEELENGNGWTKAADVKAKVVVGQRGADNKFHPTVTYQQAGSDEWTSGSAKFDNKYDATGSAVLSVKKLVNGKELKTDRSFSFELTPIDGAPMPDGKVELEANTAGSKASSFDSLQFSLADAGKTYKYRIHETTAATDGWTMAGDVFAFVTVGADQGNGKLGDATVNYVKADDEQGPAATDNGSVVFDNKYSTSGDLVLSVYKTVNSGTFDKPGEKFTFELFAANGDGIAQGNALGSLETEMGKKADFGKLSITEEGIYHYVIKEVGHSGDGWTNAPDVKVKVVAKDDGKGALSFEAEYSNANADEDAALFNNVYQASGSATLQVKKLVNGGSDDPTGSTFSFQLEQQDGAVISETAAKAGETASFQPINYTFADAGKTFTYTISEVGHNNGAWFAAEDVTATVEVSDNEDGTLATKITYSSAADDQQAALFDNAYAPASAELLVKKTVNGGKAPADTHFTFQLQPQDGAPAPAEDTADTFGGDTCGFGAIEFTEPGEYRYTIHEASDLGEGWTNAADASVTVKVVRDEQARTLKVESIDCGDRAYAEDGQQMALFDNKYEQPKQPEEATPQQPGSDAPDSDKPSDNASSGVKTGDSLALAGGALATIALVAAGIAAFALRRRKN